MVGLYTKYYCVATLFYIVIFELIFCKIPKYRINSASVLYNTFKIPTYLIPKNPQAFY